MYVPAAFAGTHAQAREMIDAYPFATVIGNGAGGMVAAHLPLLRDGDTLIGHLAGPNPLTGLLFDAAKTGTEVLAIFHAPHFYVSPTWYQAKSGTVPTWNYGAVHVYGVPRATNDKAKLRDLVSRLAAQYEKGEWRFESQPEIFIDKMLGIFPSRSAPSTTCAR
jgi:transcriptional regulator